MNEIRIYKAPCKMWTAETENGRQITVQYEIPYREIDTDGNLLRTGTEDFSPERRKQDLASVWVWIWNGRLNAGGHRWFECEGLYIIRKSQSKLFKQYLKRKYNAMDVQLRK